MWFFFVVLVTVFAWYLRGNSGSTTQELSSSQFISELQKDKIKSFSIQPSGGVYKVTGEYKNAKKVTNDQTGLG